MLARWTKDLIRVTERETDLMRVVSWKTFLTVGKQRRVSEGVLEDIWGEGLKAGISHESNMKCYEGDSFIMLYGKHVINGLHNTEKCDSLEL